MTTPTAGARERQFQATSTSFAANLRRLRSAAGMSQTDLANRIAVTQTAISYWESASRQPSFDDLDDLAVALDATVADLVNPPPTDRIPDPRARTAQSPFWLVFCEARRRYPATPQGMFEPPILQGFIDEEEARRYAQVRRCALVNLPIAEDYREASQ